MFRITTVEMDSSRREGPGLLRGFFENTAEAEAVRYRDEQLRSLKTLALNAALESTPHVYTLSVTDIDEMSFLIFGCQGNGGESQRKTAQLLNRMAHQQYMLSERPAAPITQAVSAAITIGAAAAADPSSFVSQSPSFFNLMSMHSRDISAENISVTNHTNAPITPILAIGLGDNFYDDGVKDVNDPAFVSHFAAIYANPATAPDLSKLPFWMLPGNHDYRIYERAYRERQAGFADEVPGSTLMLNQVAHTYFGLTEAKKKLYNKTYLNLKQLPHWNMPHRFYSIVCGELQFFMVDSNTYVAEYLDLLQGETHLHNQAEWLKSNATAAHESHHEMILMMHHPLFTFGKRWCYSDIHLYLRPEQIVFVKTLFPKLFENNNKPSYNALLWEVLKRQKLIFKAVFAAHEHDLSYFNNLNEPGRKPEDYLCQIVSAGGGGDLQQRRNYQQQDNAGIFLKHHGAVQLTFNPHFPKDLRFTFVSIDTQGNDEYQIEFSSHSPAPLRLYAAASSLDQRDEIYRFINTIKSAIDEYFNFLMREQDKTKGTFFQSNVTHGEEGIDRAHDLWAYISDIRTCSKSLAAIVSRVHDITKWRSMFTSPTKHSLITIINNRLTQNYGSGHTIKKMNDELHNQAPLRAGRTNIASP